MRDVSHETTVFKRVANFLATLFATLFGKPVPRWKTGLDFQNPIEIFRIFRIFKSELDFLRIRLGLCGSDRDFNIQGKIGSCLARCCACGRAPAI
jgi:hypothetical protein